MIKKGKEMKTYGEWRKVKSLCVNCDSPLESRPIYSEVPFYMSGAEPMEYRHVGRGCKNPDVYSCWGKYKEWTGETE